MISVGIDTHNEAESDIYDEEDDHENAHEKSSDTKAEF